MALPNGSMERLVEHFSTKVADLRFCRSIRGSVTDENNQELLLEIEKETTDMETLLKDLRQCIDSRNRSLETFEILKSNVEKFDKRIKHTGEHLSSMPRDALLKSSVRATPDSIPEAALIPRPMFTPMYQNRNGRVADSPGNPSSCEDSHDDTVMAVPVDKLRKMGCLMFVPSINHVTMEEFNAVPKNMKVKITLENVNTVVDEIKKAVNTKYKLLNTPKSKLSDSQMRTCRQYEEHETKETQGSYFVIGKDIASKTSINLDKTNLNILSILCHCKRIREVRGNGLTRYLIVQ